VALALIIAEPALLPVTTAIVRGALVMPSGTNTTAGNTPATPVFPLASEMNTPPAGAGAPNETGKSSVSPGGTVMVAGRRMADV